MSKCRRCGEDTSSGPSSDVPGLGWMHDLCEIKRLRGLHEESLLINDSLEQEIRQHQAEIERLQDANDVLAAKVALADGPLISYQETATVPSVSYADLQAEVANQKYAAATFEAMLQPVMTERDELQTEVKRLREENQDIRAIAIEAWRLASFHNDEATEEFEANYVINNPWLEPDEEGL